MSVPENLKFTKEHEWIRVEERVGTVGVTDFAQKELGDIVFVEHPPLQKEVKQFQECGVLESVKTVSSLFSPVSGQITEINAQLTGSPDLVNKDPYGAGWIYKIQFENATELENLLDPAQYQAHIGTLAH